MGLNSIKLFCMLRLIPLQLTHRSTYGRMLMMGHNLLTMWKGERGGGRGTFLGGGQAFAPVLGLDLVVTGV